MPHKHKRRVQDPSAFDLPPTQIAQPLPTYSHKKHEEKASKRKKQKGTPLAPIAATPIGKRKKRGGANDELSKDAPRSFKRLLALKQYHTHGGIPDKPDEPKNIVKGKKKAKAANKRPERQVVSLTKTEPAVVVAAEKAEKEQSNNDNDEEDEDKEDEDKKGEEEEEVVKEELKIRPGESMSDFAARVNAALPLSGLKKGGKDPLGLKKYRSRRERKMHRIYDQWREEERKIQKDREAAMEERAEEELERGEKMMEAGIAFRLSDVVHSDLGFHKRDEEDGAAAGKAKKRTKKTKKKSKSAKKLEREDIEDPWAQIARKRGKLQIGVHDVVQAPPELPRNFAPKLPVRDLPEI